MEQENVKKKTVADHRKRTRGTIEESFSRSRWNYMKKQFGFSYAKLLKLKEASCPAKFNNIPTTLIRYFDSDVVQERGVSIKDYESLNEHPELISYEGYHVSGRGGEIVIERRDHPGPYLVENKIKEGAITEVGVVIEKTATQKWLGRIGKFMMMGGFTLVIILILVIIVAISMASKGC